LADILSKNPHGLDDMARKFGNYKLRVGFLKGMDYPDGTPVAAVAAWNEFGATIPVKEHEQTIYRSLDPEGEFRHGARFVKRSKSDYATTHHVGAYQITIPPRPFFRNMIRDQSHKWPKMAAEMLKRNNLDIEKTLDEMGQEIAGRITESINTLMDPPNAPSTIRKKGHDKPLIDTKLMVRSPSHVVDKL